MLIEDLLRDKADRDIQSVSPDTTLAETAQMLVAHKIGALLVLGTTGEVCGIVSERDLIQIVAQFDPDAVRRPVSDIMTTEVVTCTAEDEVGYVLRLMNLHGIRHMPVLDRGSLVNILSIRELTKAYEVLQTEANTDPLTEVSNRRPFLKTMKYQFDQFRRTGTPMSVAMLDLDHFKAINDTYGHDAGDAVLRRISDLLILEFRSIDLIGRLGGEEFGVVFPATPLDGARAACDRLRRSIEASRTKVGPQEISVTASIGVVTGTRDIQSEAAMLKQADQMLYAAKAAGRNRVQAFMI